MAGYDPPDEHLQAPAKLSLTTCFAREAIVQYRGRALKAHPVREPWQTVDLARRIVRDHAHEHFLALYLDGRHRPVAHSVVSVGRATSSLVHPGEVFQTAVLTGAVAFPVLHNHPSGDPAPSAEDQPVSTWLRDAGRIIGVEMLDSIVWTHRPPRFVSMRERDPGMFR